MVRIGRERVRQILRSREITFQRTRTWKESTDPAKDAKLDRIEEVMSRFPDRCFAFDQFGPLSHPALSRHLLGPREAPGPAAGDLPPHPRHPLLPRLLRPGATTNCGVCCTSTRAATTPWPRSRSIRAARPDGAPIYVILDNLSCQHHPGDPDLGREAQGRAVPHPDQRVLGQPDRATRSRMRTAALTEGGSTDVEGVVPGPVREDRPRLGVRRG